MANRKTKISINEAVDKLSGVERIVLEAVKPENKEYNAQIQIALSTPTNKKKPDNAKWLEINNIKYEKWDGGFELIGPNGRSVRYIHAAGRREPGLIGLGKNSIYRVSAEVKDWRGNVRKVSRDIEPADLVRYDLWNLLTNLELKRPPYQESRASLLKDGVTAKTKEYDTYRMRGNIDVYDAQDLKNDAKRLASGGTSLSVNLYFPSAYENGKGESVYLRYKKNQPEKLAQAAAELQTGLDKIKEFMAQQVTKEEIAASRKFLDFYKQMYRKTNAHKHKTKYALDEFEFDFDSQIGTEEDSN